ncbi:hypothetical protein N5B55_04920 [Ralstonia pickettii]|uniref:hypothetical protein n=1 Tax=Ralstonia pickettii TaxID=329 RepID=UPI002714E35C|nr:hypothetical protein [Ralstonia pickettii]WKZ86296.1 hypothetical protein N5B55_04920 [Ralstonia pickettii]
MTVTAALPRPTIAIVNHDDLPTGGTKLSSKRLPADLEIILMRPSEWAAVPCIDVQRDTARHAARIEPHMRQFLSPHREVQAARLPDGSLVKLNGHSRDLLWQEGRIPVPDTLLVTVHVVADMEQARRLYWAYDNATAVETPTDKVFGACRRLGMEFTSSYCKEMRFSAALAAISPKHLKEKDQRIEYWQEELKALDSLGVSRATFINPVTSIFLVTMRKYGDAALVFWMTFSERGGVKDEAGYDAIEGLGAWLDARKKDGWGNGTSQKQIRNVVLGAFMAWHKNNGVRFVNPKALEKRALELTRFVKLNVFTQARDTAAEPDQ